MPKYQAIKAVLYDHGTLTGSRAWGLDVWDSDYDMFMTPDPFAELKDLLDSHGITTHEGSSVFEGAIKFDLGDREYNVWSVTVDNECAWMQASDMMSQISHTNPVADQLTDRTKRIALFELLCEFVGANSSATKAGRHPMNDIKGLQS